MTDTPSHPTSVREVTAWLAAELRAAGIETPDVDARALVGGALQLSALDLLKEPARPVSAADWSRVQMFAGRRLLHEPVSRILGCRGFYGRMFTVTPATLDPRPDTETVVDAVLGYVRERGLNTRPLRILDIGTGSGCLLITLLAELPGATGLGTDISAEALSVAQRNAAALGVDGQAEFTLARSLTGLTGPFDLVVSNPPYIPAGDIAGLAPDVVRYDPLSALDGGPDGLGIYREIAQGLGDLVPAGFAAFEVGAGQAGDVGHILATALGRNMKRLQIFNDLGGHQRCVAVETQRLLMPH